MGVRAEEPSLDLATPGTLADHVDSSVEVLKDTNGVIRQVYAPQALADVVPVTEFKYEVRFYLPADVGGLDTNGYYEVSGQPFVTWRIENPDASTSVYNRIYIQEIWENSTGVHDFVWSEEDSKWTLEKGNGLRVESRSSAWDEGGTNRTEVFLVKNGAGTLAYKEVDIHHAYTWGTQLVQKVVNPDGAALTNLLSYYDGNKWADVNGKLEFKRDPIGSWERYYYDSVGRKVAQLESWKDAPFGSLASEAKATYYDYTPVDANDDPEEKDSRPRVIIEMAQGQIVGKTYHAYLVEEDGKAHIEERCIDPNAAYEDEDNLRTVTRYYTTNGMGAAAGKTRSVEHPDGLLDTYWYEYGTYSGGTTSPGVFSAGSGTCLRQIIVHGVVGSSNGVAYKTTREVRVADPAGNTVLSESYVYTGSGYEPMTWTVQNYDDRGRLTNKCTAAGAVEDTAWNYLNKVTEVDAYGVEYAYSYDALNRIAAKTKEGISASGGYPAQEDLVTTYTYDANGKVLTEIVSGGGLSLVTSNEYDLAGRLVKTVTPAGLVTMYEYVSGGRTEVKTLPGGGTEVTTKYMDGWIKSVTGTAVIPKYYDYGVNADGTMWTLVHTKATNSPVWEKTTTDLLGRTVKIEKPGFGGGTVVAESIYDENGRLVRQTTTGSPDTLYEYDEVGNTVRSGWDVDEDETLTLASVDRIQDGKVLYTYVDDLWWKESKTAVYPYENDSASVTVSVTRTMVEGCAGCGCGGGGGVIQGRSVMIDVYGNLTASSIIIDRGNRQTKRVTDYPDSTNDAEDITVNGLLLTHRAKTGLTYTNVYDALGRVVGIVDPRSGSSVVHYNDQGRVDYVEDAAGNRTTYEYDLTTGRRIAITNTFSNTIYTAYSIQGRVTNTWGATYPVSYTYDDNGRMIEMRTWRDENSTSDVTQWGYDEATGLLTNKSYADSSSVTYSYDSAGRLSRRTWARGVTTDYDYDSLGQLESIDYSDSTPDVAFTYDRVGRQLTITDGMGTRTNTYDAETQQLISENLANGTALARSYDALGRSSGLSLDSDYALIYNYDDLGRFSSISSSVSSMVNYSYLLNSDLIAGYTNNAGLSVQRVYEPDRNLVATIENHFGGSLVSQFDYENDALGRRTLRVDTFSITNVFGYDIRSELSEANMGTNVFGYVYDSIGNRRWATNNTAVTEYLANELNQYTNITGLGTPAYDADGNMISCGDWTFVWDAENRLIVASNGATVVQNAYDYMSRRVSKTTPTATSEFLYDGWNMIRELVNDNGSLVTNSYVWGLDLSGTLRGAGGVGGLLATVRGGDPELVEGFYAYDANGNVTDLVDTNGTTVAHYEYDPYGNIIMQSGNVVSANPYRFSTKYTDDETSLLYYGFRFYSLEIGRWFSRDPMQEQVGYNLYCAMFNRPLDVIDINGAVIDKVAIAALIAAGLFWLAESMDEDCTDGEVQPVTWSVACTRGCARPHWYTCSLCLDQSGTGTRPGTKKCESFMLPFITSWEFNSMTGPGSGCTAGPCGSRCTDTGITYEDRPD